MNYDTARAVLITCVIVAAFGAFTPPVTNKDGFNWLNDMIYSLSAPVLMDMQQAN